MSGPYSCQIDGCGKTFATKSAKKHHRTDAHGIKPHIPPSSQNWLARRDSRMSAADAMEFADGCDLPDGAYWAMIEELSGAEPADFA
jgi:hypothetical protein